jgi:hypothetical protein
LDENLGDIHSDITDLENGILWRLKEAALSQFTVMMNISKVAAEIDWYCNLFYVSFIKSFEEKSFQALAAVALELGYDCAPVFHFSNRLIIRNGRYKYHTSEVNNVDIFSDIHYKNFVLSNSYLMTRFSRQRTAAFKFLPDQMPVESPYI